MKQLLDVESLRTAWQDGLRPSFFMFWGHRERAGGKVGKWCLSQWWASAFVLEGIEYATAEQYMMASKARLFGDEESLKQILASPDPAAAKRAGRRVRGFDEQIWCNRRRGIVREGNLAKFGQSPSLRSYLLSVGEDILVEASPVDSIWGIGLAESSPEARTPERWRGLNLLGFALTEVRGILRETAVSGGASANAGSASRSHSDAVGPAPLC